MRIYELLGIKLFKKMVFLFRDIIVFPIIFRIPKKERKKFLNSISSNCNLGKAKRKIKRTIERNRRLTPKTHI